MLQKALPKANQWDKLEKEISWYYSEENENEECLGDIGEVAAQAFGFL
jgi:hypothetical protein